MNVLDPAFAKRFEAVMAGAVKAGVNPLEAANMHGLLVTPKFLQQTRQQTLVSLYRRLEDKSAADILRVYTGQGHGTPEDMYRAMLQWLEDVIEGLNEGELNE